MDSLWIPTLLSETSLGSGWCGYVQKVLSVLMAKDIKRSDEDYGRHSAGGDGRSSTRQAQAVVAGASSAWLL